MSIAVIKYNAGNIFSVECALQRIGANAIITDNKDLIMHADKVIFPGVGEASCRTWHCCLSCSRGRCNSGITV